MQKYFKIGEISKLYNIGPDSLRYYEELGILTPKRSDNNYRIYSLNDLWRLNVIRDLRALDFSMEQIKTYLTDRSIDSTEQMLQAELSALDQKIELLTLQRNNVKNNREYDSLSKEIEFQTLEIELSQKRINDTGKALVEKKAALADAQTQLEALMK